MNANKKFSNRSIQLVIIALVIILATGLFLKFRSSRDVDNKSNEEKLIYTLLSTNTAERFQERKFVIFDLASLSIKKELFSQEDAKDLEVDISPDRQKIAYIKWENHMDLNLWTKNLITGDEKQVTTLINGEINRISWINDEEILYCFVSHTRKTPRGHHIRIYNIKNDTHRDILEDGTAYFYNTIRYDKGLNKLIFSRGLLDDYQRPDKLYTNTLYTSNLDGSDVKQILTMQDRAMGRVIRIPETKKLLVDTFIDDKRSLLKVSSLFLYDMEADTIKVILPAEYGEHWNVFPYDKNTVYFRCYGKLYKLNLEDNAVTEVKTKDGIGELVDFRYY